MRCKVCSHLRTAQIVRSFTQTMSASVVLFFLILRSSHQLVLLLGQRCFGSAEGFDLPCNLMEGHDYCSMLLL